MENKEDQVDDVVMENKEDQVKWSCDYVSDDSDDIEIIDIHLNDKDKKKSEGISITVIEDDCADSVNKQHVVDRPRDKLIGYVMDMDSENDNNEGNCVNTSDDSDKTNVGNTDNVMEIDSDVSASDNIENYIDNTSGNVERNFVNVTNNAPNTSGNMTKDIGDTNIGNINNALEIDSNVTTCNDGGEAVLDKANNVGISEGELSNKVEESTVNEHGDNDAAEFDINIVISDVRSLTDVADNAAVAETVTDSGSCCISDVRSLADTIEDVTKTQTVPDNVSSQDIGEENSLATVSGNENDKSACESKTNSANIVVKDSIVKENETEKKRGPSLSEDTGKSNASVSNTSVKTVETADNDLTLDMECTTETEDSRGSTQEIDKDTFDICMSKTNVENVSVPVIDISSIVTQETALENANMRDSGFKEEIRDSNSGDNSKTTEKIHTESPTAKPNESCDKLNLDKPATKVSAVQASKDAENEKPAMAASGSDLNKNINQNEMANKTSDPNGNNDSGLKISTVLSNNSLSNNVENTQETSTGSVDGAQLKDPSSGPVPMDTSTTEQSSDQIITGTGTKVAKIAESLRKDTSPSSTSTLLSSTSSMMSSTSSTMSSASSIMSSTSSMMSSTSCMMSSTSSMLSSANLSTSLTSSSAPPLVNTPSIPHLTTSSTSYPPASAVVKSEPVDNGEYGKIVKDNQGAQQNPTSGQKPITTPKIHKGHKLDATSYKASSAATLKLKMTKVSKANYVSPITQKPVPLIPKVPPPGQGQVSMIIDTAALKNIALQASKQPPNSGGIPVSSAISIVKTPRNASLTDEQKEAMGMFSTINMHSVGIARITDLIARKNPVPTYKPPPIPDNLKDVLKTEPHTCYECGDSFHLAKSLQIHMGRISMHIKYKCDRCRTSHMFTNKCQLLNHLRSHLNIDKSQAVPIHIKSDSIEIRSVYEDIKPWKPFRWFKTVDTIHDTVFEKSSPSAKKSVTCGQCNTVFINRLELVEHFKGVNGNHHHCKYCQMHLSNPCGMKAHMLFHRLANHVRVTGPDYLQLVQNLQCPECGFKFWDYATPSTPLNEYLKLAVVHIAKTCFHLSRLSGMSCSKCAALCNGAGGLMYHLKTNMEHYFKCELCPMALKSVKSIKNHFIQKHRTPGLGEVKIKAKVIYRCHICDTLIDDKSFLMKHMSSHIEEHKINNYSECFHCLHCGEMFSTAEKLCLHFTNKHRYLRQQFLCSCKRTFKTPLDYMMHVLSSNTECRCIPALINPMPTEFCSQCNILCGSKAILNAHVCLAAIDTVTCDVSDKKKSPVKDGADDEVIDVETVAVFEIGSLTQLPNPLSKTCVHCNLQFDSIGQRERHLKAHAKENVFICINCDYKHAKTYHELRSHEISCVAIGAMKKKSNSSTAVPTIVKDHDEVQLTTCSKKVSKNHDDVQLTTCSKKVPKNDDEVQLTTCSKKVSKNNDEVQLTTCSKKVPKNDDEVQLTTCSKKVSKKRPSVEVKEYFMCEECSAVFSRKYQKEQHIKAQHGIHPCHLCGLVYQCQSSLEQHLSKDHRKNIGYYYCKVCKDHKIERSFTKKETCVKHLKTKHRPKIYDESNAVFVGTFESSLGKEASPELQSPSRNSQDSPIKKLRIDGEDTFTCAKCVFVSNSKDDFREHILSHKTSDTYQCFECGLCFTVLPGLRMHVFIVHKIKDFDTYMKENMIEEPKMLEDLDVIREPVGPVLDVISTTVEPEEPDNEEEENDGGSLECNVCYREFDTRKSLIAHMRVHGMAFIRKNCRGAKGAANKRKLVSDNGETSKNGDYSPGSNTEGPVAKMIKTDH